MPEAQVPAFVAELRRRDFNPEHLAMLVQDALPSNKFDWRVGPELVAVHHARQYIDVVGAMEALAHLAPT